MFLMRKKCAMCYVCVCDVCVWVCDVCVMCEVRMNGVVCVMCVCVICVRLYAWMRLMCDMLCATCDLGCVMHLRDSF